MNDIPTRPTPPPPDTGDGLSEEAPVLKIFCLLFGGVLTVLAIIFFMAMATEAAHGN